MIVFSALLLGFIPSLIWLAFFLKEDIHPEPKKMIAKVYIWGGISSILALALEFVFSGITSRLYITLPRILQFNLSSFIIFAVIEECVKFTVVFFAVRKSPYFDEPIDAMIYAVTGALGFASAENFFLVLSNGLNGIFTIIILRFVGATLLHALASAVAGHHWAIGIKYHMEKKMIFLGLIWASILHAVFNILVWKFSDIWIYPVAFLFAVGFFILYDFEELRRMEIEEEQI